MRVQRSPHSVTLMSQAVPPTGTSRQQLTGLEIRTVGWNIHSIRWPLNEAEEWMVNKARAVNQLRWMLLRALSRDGGDAGWWQAVTGKRRCCSSDFPVPGSDTPLQVRA